MVRPKHKKIQCFFFGILVSKIGATTKDFLDSKKHNPTFKPPRKVSDLGIALFQTTLCVDEAAWKSKA